MKATLTPPTAAERAANDSYAGALRVEVSVGLDDSDGLVLTQHDLAHVLLQCADAPLDFA